MSILSKSRVFFSVIFLSLLFGGGAVNLFLQAPDIRAGLPGGFSFSLGGLRDSSRGLKNSAAWNFTGKHAAWEAHAAIQAALGKSEMNDFSVIKAADGRLYRGGWYPIYIENARQLASSVAALAEAAEKTGAGVLYLNTPDTVFSVAADKLPVNMPYLDYNIAQDAFLYTLRKEGVPYLDTRYSLEAKGLSQSDVLPKTAFLLSGPGAWAVFSDLIGGLEKRFSVKLDPDGFYRDPANYEIASYPDFFMGDLAKETGPAFSGLDDFISVTPAFETDFSYEALDMFGNFSKTEGEAARTILNPDALVYFNDLYDLYPQSYYRHSNTAWSRVVNRLNPQGPKVLVVHDFYSAQIISHLAPLCGELHTLAYQENLPMNAEQYIQSNGFDYVIISFFSQNLLRPEMQSLLIDEKSGDKTTIN